MHRYPIYIVSKGRAESRLTSKALERMKCDYKIVIESQEFDEYAKYINKEKILVLPFSNLGQGSIPARNWIWEHSINEGHNRHWILDDNIRGFHRLHKNKKHLVMDDACFSIVEDFVDRYENIPMAGLQYKMFAPSKEKKRAVCFNTRIYSCILLSNKIPYRWRGRYNEDTDLSIRILKDGYCTALVYAFLADKMNTMKMKGGNTESLYKEDGRLKMAQSLQQQHPDIVTIKQRWGRWQHVVDYRKFKSNKLIKKQKYRINRYNLELVSANG